MDRSEPSLIPGWLKAAAGGGVPHLSQPVLYQDDGGSPFAPRHRSTQQLPAVGVHVDYESPRSSERFAFPSSRRGPTNSSSSLDRACADRDNFPHARSYTVLTRNSSIGSHGTPERDRDGFRGDGLRDWDREGERDLRSRERDRSLGLGADEREWDRPENGLLQFPIPGALGKFEVDTMSRRSQSTGLSLRIPDNGVRKLNDAVGVASAVPSSSGVLPTSMHKTAFERNFPSLGADEKQGARPMSPGNAGIASPRPLWQGSSRPDLGRVSSPGLTGSFGGSVSTMSSGADLWSSALAEAPSLNGNGQSYGLAANALSASTPGLVLPVSPGPGSAASLNMAEALIQNPPRVRTPPQLSMESQRLEELALKQSRQLIPMTPSLPKAMSLVDKTKSKPSRTGDVVASSSKVSQLSGSSQLNSPHRSLASTRPDVLKVSQGKLLVLKSGKDGGTSIIKSDGSTAPSHGTFGVSAPVITGASFPVPATAAQCKQSLDRRASLMSGSAGPDGLAGVRAKDFSHMSDDKRPSLQNRSDFFNALRKKASGNGRVSSNTHKSDSIPQPKSDVNLREAMMPLKSVDHGSEFKENGVARTSDCMRLLSEIHSNGDVEHTPESGMNADGSGSLAKVSSAVHTLDGNSVDSPLPGDSEEEEAAFMRSLGWEENAEGSELTEEEINAFFKMRERQNLLHSSSCHRFGNLGSENRLGSLGSATSGLSSSDSESDDVLHS